MVSRLFGKSSSSTFWLSSSPYIAAWRKLRGFFARNWIGTAVILAATLLYFWPIIIHITNYSPGGDAMFNAWEMRRNQNCILHQGCPNYFDANIFFPHKDTMLYSETQLSAGFVTLPFYWVSANPILEYNVLTIALFFLSGWFMYLLAKHVSKGHEALSVLAGLIFAYAPFKMAAVYHLQNLSVCFLPLAVLMILLFFEQYTPPSVKKWRLLKHSGTLWRRVWQWTKSVYAELKGTKKYLVGLLLALLYVFFASWVQMFFVGIIIGLLLVCLLAFRQIKLRAAVIVAAVVVIAAACTLPLVMHYLQFAKENHAGFSVREQVLYATDLRDFVTPYDGTLLGKAYYALHPGAIHNSYNPDSYSYYGVTLYALAAVLFISAWRQRKKGAANKTNFAWMATLGVIIAAGVIMSLGPVLKFSGYAIRHVGDLPVAIAMPWALVDKLLPQLSFLRAIGRAGVLILFGLCVVLALLAVQPMFIRQKRSTRRFIVAALWVLLVFELMPVHSIAMSSNAHNYNLSVPKVYQFIKNRPDINNIVILNADYDYPNEPIVTARAEQVLWAGYHNKNIFNGYSGYEPPEYIPEFNDYVDFAPNDVPKLKAQHIQYVLVDKLLMTSKPWVNDRVATLLHTKVYEDGRYALYKVQ